MIAAIRAMQIELGRPVCSAIDDQAIGQQIVLLQKYLATVPDASQPSGFKFDPAKVRSNIADHTLPGAIITLQSAINSGPAAYLGPVASRVYYPDSKAGTSGGWNSRTSHYARDAITALKLIFVNGYAVGGTGETASGAVSTTTASVEYPAGTFTQVTFNSGSVSAAIASGAVQVSDFATVSIPKNAQFWVRRFQQTTQLVFSNKNNGHTLNLSLGDAANNINTDFTMSGSVVDNGGGSIIPVQGIVAMTVLPTIGVLGSSRTAGKLDTTLDATGLYGYARMYSAAFGTLDYAITGDKSTIVSTSAADIRKTLINTYCSHLWFDPGLNDINGSPGTASSVLAALDTVATAFPGGKARTIINNEGPWTTTTDAWATSVNQTPFANEAQRVLLNTSLAGLTGYNQLVDVASFMSNGANGSLWNNPAVGGSQYTTDGIHEISAPLVALAASGRFNAALVVR